MLPAPALAGPRQPPPLRRTALLPQVDTACCCCELETCCRVQGWWGVVGSFCGVIAHMCEFWDMDKYMKKPPHPGDPPPTAPPRTDPDEEEPLWFLLFLTDVVNVTFIFVNIINMFAAWHFLKGIEQRRPERMVMYIRHLVLYIAVGFLVALFIALLKMNVLYFLAGFPLYAAMPYYMLVCACSLHLRMTTSTELAAFPKAPHHHHHHHPAGPGLLPAADYE